MTDQPPPQGVKLLKELLFERETMRLDELTRRLDAEASAGKQREGLLSERLDAVFERAGTEERLLHSVSNIIDGALRAAEIVRHEPLSQAIAPLIVRTIKIQLRDSQDEMVDALYPITGRLVKSYVQAEVNRRMIEINARLGGGRPAALASKSAATGVSMGDLALADANRLRVEEVFLVRRGSGDLIAHWEKDTPAEGAARPGGSNRDVLISGYISGIMTFSEEAFGAAPGSFRTLELEDGDRIFVRGSAAHLLAVRCRGTAGPVAEQVIDEVFLDTLERYQQVLVADGSRRSASGNPAATSAAQAQTRAEIAAILPNVGKAIEKQTFDRQAALTSEQAGKGVVAPSLTRLYVLIGLLATPFLLWGAWSAYQTFETTRTESAANRVLETIDDIKGVPPKVEVARGGRALTLSGFVPSPALRDEILTRLGQEVPQAKVHNQLGILPRDATEVEAALAQWRTEAERQRQDAQTLAVNRSIARVRPRLEAVRIAVVRQEQQGGSPASPALAELRAALDTALDRTKPLADLRPPETSQLADLWAALNLVDTRLSSLLSGTPAPISPTESQPTDRAQLAEDAGLLAERIGAAGLGLGVPTNLTALGARIDRLRPPTPRDELEQFVRANAIFFGNGTDFRDPGAANAILDQLARRLRDNPDLTLRIVGYTDERGGQAINSNLAQNRADRVAAVLADRGVGMVRVVSVGRLTNKDLSRSAGPNSANRRVEFELGFTGEAETTP